MFFALAKYVFYLAVFFNVSNVSCDITISTNEIIVEVNSRQSFTISVSNFNKSNVSLYFNIKHDEIIRIDHPTILLEPRNKSYIVSVEGTEAGHTEVTTTSSDAEVILKQVYIVANVFKNNGIDIVSQISGWIYFITWALAYYPQIYINFKRKSVVGLSFDYLALNIVGYISFGIFIHSMYFSHAIQDEYFERYSQGLLPVKVNDVFYNFHGLFALTLTIVQCFIYERGTQKISITATVILALFGCFYLIVFILRAVKFIQWLDLLYYCSYLKLVITMLKYVPQAYLNYKRKSTSGWSIGVVNLNLAGGFCSLTQMILDSYNYNDWLSIFGNPTKFGLGVFTVVFQILFMVQHYILYKTATTFNTKF